MGCHESDYNFDDEIIDIEDELEELEQHLYEANDERDSIENKIEIMEEQKRDLEEELEEIKDKKKEATEKKKEIPVPRNGDIIKWGAGDRLFLVVKLEQVSQYNSKLTYRWGISWIDCPSPTFYTDETMKSCYTDGVVKVVGNCFTMGLS